jgi:Flp pilus assembly protein TadB
MIWTVVLAILSGAMFGAGYLIWPRRVTAAEWVAHRRLAEGFSREGPSHGRGWSGAAHGHRLGLPAFLQLPEEIGQDLALLRLAASGLPVEEEELRRRLALTGAAAAGLGIATGLAVWLAQGAGGFPALAAVLPIGCGLGAPALFLRLLRRRAQDLRDTIEINLPRVLTGARMLLESGAATPETALTRAAALYRDAATDVLREAGRIREVELVGIDVALDAIATRYGLIPLGRLGDAYRIGTQYGTGMAAVLADFADYLRRQSENAEKGRITSAPVRMVPVALGFFLLPFMLIVAFLVFSPLASLLGRV